MKAAQFTFSFKHLGKMVKATCQKFKVFKFPQYRVSLPTDKKYNDVFIFYEVDEPGNKFFSFEYKQSKGALAKTIAKALERKVKDA